ncbi:MAG: HAD family phosphatase [Peptococcaceae bacterium]|nr:HAD family phosphatase [Peptococcaceae bacterium]
MPAIKKTKLVCFDLDGTLTKDIHSVMFLCILNMNLEKLLEIERQEASGKLHWIEADYQKAKLIKGLAESEIKIGFDKILQPLKNITPVVDALRQNDIQSIVVTAGPIQVARAAKEKWGLDGFYGSDYEVINGIFTGRILSHMGDTGKIACLKDYCERNKIESTGCVAVGDGISDISLFEYCQTSIAINYSPAVAGKATYYLNTNDLFDITRHIPGFIVPGKTMGGENDYPILAFLPP